MTTTKPMKRSGLRSLAALAVLALALAAMAGIALAPHLATRFVGERIEQGGGELRRLVGEARSTADRSRKRADELASSGHLDFLLAGETIGIAGAELQRILLERLARQGGSVSSVQVHEPTREGALERISMSVNARVNLRQLRDLLIDLESGTPLLFVEEMSVLPAEERKVAGREPVLNVALRVAGYLSAKPGV